MELPSADGEECTRMVWFSFESLNETFNIEPKEGEPEGCWVELFRSDIPGPTKGIPNTEEQKELISLANKGRKRTAETREKMRRAKLGTKHTEETKEKMRKSHLGKGYRGRKCVVDGVEYRSISAASRATGIPITTLHRRINN